MGGSLPNQTNVGVCVRCFSALIVPSRLWWCNLRSWEFIASVYKLLGSQVGTKYIAMSGVPGLQPLRFFIPHVLSVYLFCEEYLRKQSLKAGICCLWSTGLWCGPSQTVPICTVESQVVVSSVAQKWHAFWGRSKWLLPACERILGSNHNE